MWNSSLLPYCTPLDFHTSWLWRLTIYCRHCTMLVTYGNTGVDVNHIFINTCKHISFQSQPRLPRLHFDRQALLLPSSNSAGRLSSSSSQKDMVINPLMRWRDTFVTCTRYTRASLSSIHIFTPIR
jgi:hypothetical protein